QAVGRLNIGGQGHCTATLIAPDLIVTAAHCLENARTGARWRAERLVFLPGYDRGAYAALTRGAEIAVPEAWSRETLALDIAALRIDPPVETVAPFAAEDLARPGLPVWTVSYGRDRPEAPSREAACEISARQGDLVLTTCEATPGVSGAPVFTDTPDGPVLVGVAVAAVDARPPAMRGRALAVAAGPLLSHLVAVLRKEVR
ncbi:MAG: trypsin-like peptidase domain-containing protein, partial [Pseudomonadota bacterium]